MTWHEIALICLTVVTGYFLGRWSIVGNEGSYWAGWRAGWRECRYEFEDAYLRELAKSESNSGGRITGTTIPRRSNGCPRLR